MKKHHQTAIKDPESCVNWIKSEEENDWDGILYPIMDEYRKKTGRDMPDTYIPDFRLKGEPFDEDAVFKQYPRLAKKFKNASN